MEEEQKSEIQIFIDELEKQGIELEIWQHFHEQKKDKINLPAETKTFSLSEHLSDEIEFIIRLGGDGTLLVTATLVRDRDISIMGINFGRLGFLASIGRDEVKTAVKSIAQRCYIIDKRNIVH